MGGKSPKSCVDNKCISYTRSPKSSLSELWPREIKSWKEIKKKFGSLAQRNKYLEVGKYLQDQEIIHFLCCRWHQWPRSPWARSSSAFLEGTVTSKVTESFLEELMVTPSLSKLIACSMMSLKLDGSQGPVGHLNDKDMLQWNYWQAVKLLNSSWFLHFSLRKVKMYLTNEGCSCSVPLSSSIIWLEWAHQSNTSLPLWHRIYISITFLLPLTFIFLRMVEKRACRTPASPPSSSPAHCRDIETIFLPKSSIFSASLAVVGLFRKSEWGKPSLSFLSSLSSRAKVPSNWSLP